MSVYCIVNSRQKLHDPTRKIFLNEPLMFNNNLAHCFRLTLLADNGTDPADLTGVSVSANFIRPDRSTVAIDGTKSGNVVEVVLPNACYSSVGRYKLTVDIGEGTGSSAATRTALIVEGITERNVTDTYVDPGTIMPSINTLISEINDAVDSIPADYDTLLDSIAQTFSESVNYKAGDFVWHGDLADGGKLYRFTEDHAAGAWTGTDVVEAVVTDGVEGNVRYDEVQALTVAQQMHGRVNIQAQHRIEPDGSVALELNDSESATITGDVGQQIQYSTSAASLTFKHVAFVQGGCDYVLSLTSGQLASANARVQAIVDDSDVIIQRFNASVAENATTETRFTAEADGILCVCVDASTEDNIQLHGGPVYGTVRYDTAQSLTDAQKTTARGNIEAASLIPSGTAFSQAVQGGTTYDVQDSAAVHYTAQTLTDAQKEQARVNAGVVNARGMVNYGYDTPGSGTAGTSDATRIAYTRVGTLLTLNGTSTSIWRLRISGTTIRMAATPPTSVTAVHTVLNPAHDYRFVLRLISGTCTRDDDGLLLYLTPYNASTQTQLALRESWQDDSGNYYRMIPASTIPSDGKVSFLLSTGSGTTFTNAVFEAVLEDVTERTGETGDLYTALEYGGRSLAPSDTPTAANTHTAGSLLTVGGTLYKATQAIAPGTVITPGTNVTKTTVAKQFAERDTAIAAETAARETAIAGLPMSAEAYFAGLLGGNGTTEINRKRVVVTGNHIHMEGMGSGTSASTYAMFNTLGTTGGVSGSYTVERIKSLFTGGYCYTVEGRPLFATNTGHILRVTFDKRSNVEPKNNWGWGYGLYTYNADTDTVTNLVHNYTMTGENGILIYDTPIASTLIDIARENGNLALVIYGKTDAQWASSKIDLYWEIIPVTPTT